VSIAGGAWKALARGSEAGCSTIQIFTKNASRWQAPPLTEKDVLRFREAGRESGIRPLVAHDSYLINLASPSADLRARSRQAFLEELERAERLGLDSFVAHPGAHTGSGTATAIRRVAESLDWAHDRTAGFRVKICLENTAGQGSVLAGDFGHLGEIFSRVREPERLGVCFDTCHAFAAGYDLRRRKGYEESLESLEGAVGKGKVLVVHTNDAKGELGGRLDRHEHLGRGRIGLECFRLVMNDPRFREVPKILETPKEEDGLPMDPVNLALLRALEGAKRLPPRLLERTKRRIGKDRAVAPP
jgi:deoxyribonuclease-4